VEERPALGRVQQSMPRVRFRNRATSGSLELPGKRVMLTEISVHARFTAGIVTVLAIVAVYRLSNPVPAGPKAFTIRLVLASRDLEPGTILRDGDVVLTDWPGVVPADAFSHTQDVVDRGVIFKIYAKEPILERRLAPKGAGGAFSAVIPNGMLAVAVPVNEVAGDAGFVVAGMHVDVLISGTPPSSAGGPETVTRTLLQNVEVLFAGQDFNKDAEGKPLAMHVVTLLVSPEQAEALSLASHQTTIQLLLRNPFDREVPKAPLFPADVPPPPPNKPAKPVLVRLY
jgi:pilus assembly protein CpaB